MILMNSAASCSLHMVCVYLMQKLIVYSCVVQLVESVRAC